MKTYSTAEKPLKVIQKSEALTSFKAQHNLFLRLLTVSKTKTVDLRNVVLYELSGLPLSIFQSTAEQRKSEKTKLLHELEVKECSVKTVGFHHDSATILDFMAVILSTIQKKVGTFGQLLGNLNSAVSSAFQESNTIVLVPNRHDVKHSIKSAERSRRQQSVGLFSSVDQNMPKNCSSW